MPFPRDVSPAARRALADVVHEPFWTSQPGAPDPGPALVEDIEADLVVLGGGFSGLWTAYLAAERMPGRRIVLLEADRVAAGASGRNGGFCAASLTHGLPNGQSRWPGQMPELVRQGQANLDAIVHTIQAEAIDCDLVTTGEMDVAVEPYQLDGLAELVELGRAVGVDLDLLDAEDARAVLDSPTYVGGVLDRTSVAMVDPARLAWGLADACRRRGVEIYEGSPVRSIDSTPSGLVITTDLAQVRSPAAALGTAAFPPVLRRLRWYVVPVYDSVLVTEPLTADQRSAIGWASRVGAADVGNQFHYYRMTEDGRILWGGYDASYYGSVNPDFERRGEPFARLSEHFRWTFPQLDGIRFSHAWAGPIDTCSRFSAFWGTAYGGRLAYSLGFTGLGVGASRFGANVMLDLLLQEETERTKLSMVRSKPLPFPPEPVRSLGIQVTRRAIDRADREQGRRNLWLRTLDRIGLGFDS